MIDCEEMFGWARAFREEDGVWLVAEGRTLRERREEVPP